MATDPNPPQPMPGFGRLARRISAITTNCLLTAIILIAGLGFGRQVLRWWAADPAESGAALPPAGVDALGDPARMHVMQFGDQSWSIRRQAITGDKPAAVTALRANCRQALTEAGKKGSGLFYRNGPKGASHKRLLTPFCPGKAERELLARLTTQKPVQQESGKWRIYELSEAFPLVVGTRANREVGEQPVDSASHSSHQIMATLGLAIPNGPQAWTVYTFQPESRSERAKATQKDVPLPPGCRRTLALRVVSGGTTVAFEGPRRAKSAVEFYDEWFSAHGRGAVGGWRHYGNQWNGRYHYTDRGVDRCVDLHLGGDGHGRLTGLIVVTPVAPEKGH